MAAPSTEPRELRTSPRLATASGRSHAWRLAVLALPALVVLAGAGGGARVEDALRWHAGGVWLAGDIHTHYITTKEKQGAKIVATAREQGLDFLVSTDHAEDALWVDSERRLARRRATATDLILLAGIEWNVPGGDHASVVVEQAPGEYELLRDFAERFDRKISAALLELAPGANGDGEPDEDARDLETWGDVATAAAALRWLADQAAAGRPDSAVNLNHPGKYGYLSRDEVGLLLDAGLAAVDAAPGHQLQDPLWAEYAIDRHEPFVAVVGGDYDQLVAAGRRIGLSASSDFHVIRTSFPPGVFSRTLVYAPARSAAGVVDGLAAGATATVLGGIVDTVETRTTAAGFADAALPAETLRVPAGTAVTYRILGQVPAVDFEGQPNSIDRVEIISDCGGPPRIAAVLLGPRAGTMSLEWPLPASWTEKPGECFLRVRGRRFVGGPGNGARDADYLFHVAPTRLRVVG